MAPTEFIRLGVHRPSQSLAPSRAEGPEIKSPAFYSQGDAQHHFGQINGTGHLRMIRQFFRDGAGEFRAEVPEE